MKTAADKPQLPSELHVAKHCIKNDIIPIPPQYMSNDVDPKEMHKAVSTR